MKVLFSSSLLICSLILVSCTSYKIRKDVFENDVIDNFVDNLVQNRMANTWRPQDQGKLVVGVYLERNGEVLLQDLIFYSNDSNPLPRESTVFKIGSVTKTFTAALFAKEASAGTVDLFEQAQNYLPEVGGSIATVELPKVFDGETSDITISDLLTHSSGLSRFAMTRDFSTNLVSYPTGFDSISNTQLAFLPGSDCFLYSNVAFGVAAAVLSFQHYPTEEQYYDFFEELMIDSLLGPLNMNDTRFKLETSQKARRAIPYKTSGAYSTYEVWPSPINDGGGGLYSTPRDMLKYGNAMVGNSPEVLSEEEINSMIVRFNTRRQDSLMCSNDSNSVSTIQGLGWEFKNDMDAPDGSNFIRYVKGGKVNGFTARIDCTTTIIEGKEYKAFVFILTNHSDGSVSGAKNILQRIIDMSN